MIPLIAAGIGAAGSLIGSGISALVSNSNANKNIAMNERLTQKQMDFADRQATIAYERQQALMDKNNAYNDPTAQMARLKQAGLNPYLAYDKGNATIQASSASVQQAATPSAVAVPDYYANGTNILASGIGVAFQNFAQLVRLKNETKLADAQAANLTASTGNTNVQTELAKKMMPLQLDEIRLRNEATDIGIEKIKVEKLLNSAQIDLVKAQTEREKVTAIETTYKAIYQEALNKYVDKRQAAELAQILANARLAAAQEDSVRVATSLQKFIAESQRMTAISAMNSSKKESFEQTAAKIINSLFSAYLGGSDEKTIGNSISKSVGSAGSLLLTPLNALTELNKLYKKKK